MLAKYVDGQDGSDLGLGDGGEDDHEELGSGDEGVEQAEGEVVADDAPEAVAEVCEDPGEIGAEGEAAVGIERAVQADLVSESVAAEASGYSGGVPTHIRPTSSASFGHGPPFSPRTQRLVGSAVSSRLAVAEAVLGIFHCGSFSSRAHP